MTPIVASKAERLVSQRLKTQIQAASMMSGVSTSQIFSQIPEALSKRLGDPRFRARLERRFLRKTQVGEALTGLVNGPAESIIAYGEYGLQALIVDTGIVCHYAALRRIVDSTALSELSEYLGIALSAHDVRLVKASESLSLAHLIGVKSPAGVEPLAAAILQDGLQCWACWIHRQPEGLHGFFRQLTPPTLCTDGLPFDDRCRERECRLRADLFDIRRALVAEIDDMPVRRKA